eukprot:m.303768 g.303768  ORF g.303768 m.303768 type:complete len:195 (+) comp27306_c0_seq3:261-845(+)
MQYTGRAYMSRLSASSLHLSRLHDASFLYRCTTGCMGMGSSEVKASHAVIGGVWGSIAQAKALVERGWIPELVLSSSSRRTVNTWELMAPHVSPTPAVWFAHELYHSPPLPWVQAEAEGGRLSKIETLMLVGHNPWWEMAAEELTDRSVVLKTASALLMESELDVGASWDDALRAQWTIDKLIHPRELMFTEQD